MSKFEALRGDLESLQKAMPQGAAAGTADGASGAAAAGSAAAGATNGEGSDTDELLGKSFSLTLEDGTSIDAVDGTELVKSFGLRLAEGEASFAKAMDEVASVMGAQNALIKSMADQIAVLRGGGAGRRSVLSVTETVPARNTAQPLAKALTGASVVAAAERAWKGGAMSSTRLAEVETLLGKSMPLPQDLADICAAHMA